MENFTTSEKEKRKVAIYIRVSTTEQKIDGYGLEAQRSKLLDYVNNNLALNLTTKPEWIFEDVHTGSDLNRKGYERMMKAVRENKFDAVLVLKIDRLSRNLKHLLAVFETLKTHNTSFISVQENIDFKGPIGNLIFQIFGAIAQFERELIKGRTLMGKIASAELGNYTGHSIPYGYEPKKNPGGKGKKLILLNEEKKWVKQIYDWYIYEALGYGQIATKLNGLKVPRGKHTRLKRDKFAPWTANVVSIILTNPIYRGEFVANRKDESGIVLPEAQWTIVNIPPCVSEFTFQQAQVARKKHAGGNRNATRYLLSGKLRDMTLAPSKAFTGALRHKGGYSYRRKQFTDKNGTHVPVFEIPAKPIEEYVWAKVMEAMSDPEVFVKHYLSKEYADPSKIEKLESTLTHLRGQKMNTDMAIERIESAYEYGSFSEEKMSKKVTEKNSQIAEFEKQIQQIEDELSFISSIDIEVQKLKEASEQIKYRLENLSQKQKQILCNLFVDKVEMYRSKKDKTKKKGGWEITAEIYFRFNPAKFKEAAAKGRTQKELSEAKNGVLSDEKDLSGAQERT